MSLYIFIILFSFFVISCIFVANVFESDEFKFWYKIVSLAIPLFLVYICYINFPEIPRYNYINSEFIVIGDYVQDKKSNLLFRHNLGNIPTGTIIYVRYKLWNKNDLGFDKSDFELIGIKYD